MILSTHNHPAFKPHTPTPTLNNLPTKPTRVFNFQQAPAFIMQLSLLALTLAAALPFVSAYPVKETLSCRSGPGTNYKIVKTYAKGANVKISCQTTGTNIKGNNLWDKTSDGCYAADYYIKTGTSGYVAAKCGASGGGGGGSSGGGSGNLPGLNAKQTKHARAIVGQAKKDGVGRHGCEAGIATALVEVRPPQPGRST